MTFEELQVEGIKALLSKMFTEQEYFDITSLDLALQLLNRAGQKTTVEYQTLRAFHCVHFKNMTPEVRKAVTETSLVLVFGSSSFDQLFEDILNKPRTCADSSSSMLARFFGRPKT